MKDEKIFCYVTSTARGQDEPAPAVVIAGKMALFGPLESMRFVRSRSHIINHLLIKLVRSIAGYRPRAFLRAYRPPFRFVP